MACNLFACRHFRPKSRAHWLVYTSSGRESAHFWPIAKLVRLHMVSVSPLEVVVVMMVVVASEIHGGSGDSRRGNHPKLAARFRKPLVGATAYF